MLLSKSEEAVLKKVALHHHSSRLQILMTKVSNTDRRSKSCRPPLNCFRSKKNKKHYLKKAEKIMSAVGDGGEEEEDDSADERQEKVADYVFEGYHPVHVGELMDNRYIVLKKLGWGHFSTVWLAFNIKDKRLYALKIMRGHPRYLRTAFDEEAINRVVADNHDNPTWVQSVKDRTKPSELGHGNLASRDQTHCLQMYDWFFHHGPHGRHFTMCFEVLGKNLFNLISKYDHRGIPIPLVREITRQLLLSLDYLHRICKLIHTDLKPENVTFAISQEEEFELLYRHVFLSKELLKVYEQKDAIVIGKKQKKNLKKRERRKRKKLLS